MNELPDLRASPEPVTRKTVEDYLASQDLVKPLTPAEAERFIALAIRYQLNPYLRELHLVQDFKSGKFVAVVGYEVYLRKAERTGKLDGWKSWTVGEGENLKAVLEIYRHDWNHPFVHEAFYREAVQRNDSGQPTAFWENKPKFQLRKVCISQGFRLCFPDDLGGIPYEPAELNLNEVPSTSSVSKPAKSSPAANSRVAFDDLDGYLKDNAEAFTPKHLGWIKQQLEKTPTPEKAKAMLAYARKVVFQGGDTREQSRSPRTSGNRRREEAVPEPTF